MTYRLIHTEFWSDAWVLDLDPAGKLLFNYLFSNDRTHMIGLYEIAWKMASFHTGLDMDTIESLLVKFQQDGKVKVSGNWVWVKNLLVRNVTNIRSPQVQKSIHRAIRDIPNSCPFKAAWVEHYNTVIAPQYGIDTISLPDNTISAVADTFCSASASDSVSVSDSVLSIKERSVGDLYVKVRGGAVNMVDVDRLNEMIEDCEQHRQALPRASPGADLSGEEWVKAAILTGNDSRKGGIVTINYIRAILDRWKSDGFKAKWKTDNDDRIGGL